MKKYSVWYMPYNKKYLITHPWQWCRCAWHCIKDAWRRSVYGWTYGDVWDWNTWFLRTTPNMLRYMADHGDAFPGREPFDTAEKWHDWLHEIADLLETGSEEWQEEHNEYYKEYIEKLTDKWEPWKPDENGMYHVPAPKCTELDEKFFVRSKELAEQGEANVRRVFENLGKFFYDLWD